ncbi:EH signature domain-containing protein [Bosea vaviloviae]|uniref:Zorya protein ZorC EH domain-containing protein n=1 Tax=Bosea vaviloviae TaxID=1526658 RepID=A0A0N0MAA4_9HYPH|nr:EH signature domain-containing protein [Bosea vaviloviae]KPH79414.1 hypothetical protein AE618_19270 [Bosea vaviloviae]
MPAALADFLLGELSVSTRKTLLGALCDGYLTGWRQEDLLTRKLAGIIQARSSWLPSRWQAMFMAVPEALDLEEGPKRFGQRLAAEPDPYRASLASGIAAPHDVGFMAAVHSAWLAAIPSPESEVSARRVLAWITPRDAPQLESDRGASAVQRLLMPWQSKMAPADLRSVLLPALTTAYGDPRRDRPEFWTLVSDDARRVIFRWLAGRSMEAFIDVVSRAEAAGAYSAQWASRRRFWMGLYEKGRIDEAWVALTRDAQAIAASLFQQTKDPAYESYGKQEGARKKTCLLVMRIGNLIVVEGSHDFRVHVFRTEDTAAPRLYASGYDAESFLLPVGHHDARMHDTAGNWMRWVERKIR